MVESIRLCSGRSTNHGIEYGDGSDSNGGRIIKIIQQTHDTESTSTGSAHIRTLHFQR